MEVSFSSISHYLSTSEVTNDQFSSRSGFLHLLESPQQNPHLIDGDSDGIPDYWEAIYGLDPIQNDSGNDFDSDGLSNLAEYALELNPRIADFDEDGLLDGQEVNGYGTNPTMLIPMEMDFPIMMRLWKGVIRLTKTRFLLLR